MGDPLDDIAFLANSANRVAVLQTLASESLHRDELGERIDASRVTLTRILSDLESRRWIDRSGQECEVTSMGAWVAEEFDEFQEMMRSQHQLRTVWPWFPDEEISFDISRLHDVDIFVPSPTNMESHVRRSADCLRSAQHVRVLSAQTAPSLVEATSCAVEEHEQRFEGVLTQELLETVLRDSTMAPLFTALLDTPTVDIYVYEDELPVSVFIADESVGFLLTDANGIAHALILSTDRTVLEWAETTFQRYRARANPIDWDAIRV